MKKTLLSLILFCVINSLFGQVQKGTFYLGSSEFAVNQTYKSFPSASSNIEFIIAPQYGYFIKDNMLIGGSIGVSILARTTETNATSIRPSLLASAFAKRYFLKNQIKPFIATKLYLNDKIGASLEIGGAYFINEFASIELSFSNSLLELGNNPPLLPDGIEPQIGLSMKWFLLKNKYFENKILAKNYLRKGTLNTYLSGNHDIVEKRLNSSIQANYFFANNVYANINIDLETDFDTDFGGKLSLFDLNSRLELGTYFPLGNLIALKFSGAVILHPHSQYGSRVRKILLAGGDTKFGLVLFKDKHKLELLGGIQIISFEDKKIESTPRSVTNFLFQANHEFFIFRNLSILSQLDFLPKHEQFDYCRQFAPIFGSDIDAINFKIGVKWYLNSHN